MITNLHEGNEAWLASLRSNIITIFELADVGRTKGYIDMEPTDIFGDYTISIAEVRRCLAAEGIETGHDLNKWLRQQEADGLDKDDIENELLFILELYLGDD